MTLLTELRYILIVYVLQEFQFCFCSQSYKTIFMPQSLEKRAINRCHFRIILFVLCSIATFNLFHSLSATGLWKSQPLLVSVLLGSFTRLVWVSLEGRKRAARGVECHPSLPLAISFPLWQQQLSLSPQQSASLDIGHGPLFCVCSGPPPSLWDSPQPPRDPSQRWLVVMQGVCVFVWVWQSRIWTDPGMQTVWWGS